MDPDRWEFANEGFLKGQKQLLKTIRRRKPTPSQPHLLLSLAPSLEIGRYALDGEIDRLKRDKNMLMAEVIKLRQAHQNTRAVLRAMEERLQITEKKQQHAMSFLAKAMQNPNFLQQLAQQEHRRKELEEAITKKRRRPIDYLPNEASFELGGQEPQLEGQELQLEGQELHEFYSFPESELDSLAIEIQGLENTEGEEEHEAKRASGDAELNDEFWEELLNEGIGEEEGDDDITALAEKLGSVGPNSPK